MRHFEKMEFQNLISRRSIEYEVVCHIEDGKEKKAQN
jgi:hypothetical protein